MDILSNRMLPQRAADVESALQVGHKDEALSLVAPAETFYLAMEYRRRFPDKIDDEGADGKELETLSRPTPTLCAGKSSPLILAYRIPC